MSVQRAYAQRNGNNNQIIPVYAGMLPNTFINNCAVYTLNLPTVQNVKGIYYVDLSGVDLSGNLLDVAGTFQSLDLSSNSINIIAFAINVPAPASYYPGLEFTIFFKNIPFDRLINQILTIGIVSFSGAPIPYIVCPPVPAAIAPVSPSITLKSDGSDYNVVSSGPAGWMGAPALGVILNAYSP